MSDLPSQEELLRRARYAGNQQEYSQPSPENDRISMLMQGLGTLAAVYGGLQSFGGKYGGLFGEMGEAAMDPMKALMEFVQESRRRYQKGGGGYEAAQEALLGYADTGRLAGLDENGNSTLERARKNAAQNQKAARQADDMSVFMAEQKLRGAISDMARDLSSTRSVARSRDEARRTGKAPPSHYEYEWAENPKLVALQRVESQVGQADEKKKRPRQDKKRMMRERAESILNQVLMGKNPKQKVPLVDNDGNISRRVAGSLNAQGEPEIRPTNEPRYRARPLFDLKAGLEHRYDQNAQDPLAQRNNFLSKKNYRAAQSRLGDIVERRLRDFIETHRNKGEDGKKSQTVNQVAYNILSDYGLGYSMTNSNEEFLFDELVRNMRDRPAEVIRAINTTVSRSNESFYSDLLNLAALQSTRLQKLLSGKAPGFPKQRIPSSSEIPLAGKDPKALFEGVLREAWEDYTAREAMEAGTRLRTNKGMSPVEEIENTGEPRFKQKTGRMSLDDLKTFLALDSSYQRIVEDKIRALEGNDTSLPKGFGEPSKGATKDIQQAINQINGPLFTRTVSDAEFQQLRKNKEPLFNLRGQPGLSQPTHTPPAPEQDQRRAAAVLYAHQRKTGKTPKDRSVGVVYVNDATGEVTRSNVAADSELFDMYAAMGRTPTEATGDREAKMGVPHAADVTQSSTFANTNFSAIATGVMGDKAMDLFQSETGSVLDQLQQRAKDQINYYLDQLKKETGQEFTFEFERVDVDERHQSLVATIYEGGRADVDKKLDSVEIGIVSDGQDGPATYRTTGQDRAYTNPLMQIDQTGLYAHDKAREIVSDARNSNLIRGEERALIGMANYAEKFVNDLRGGRGEFSMSLFRRIVEGSFEGSKLVGKSPMDTARSALQIETAVEKRVGELSNNPTRREQVRQGLESLDNYRRLFNSGGRFFTSDSEFVSPENIGEAGVSSSAKAPFDVAGSVVDAKSSTTVATLEYMMNLKEARKAVEEIHKKTGSGAFADTEMAKNQDALEEEIKRIYTELSHFSESEAEEKLAEMKDEGRLRITTGDGKKFNLLNNKENKAAQKHFPWVRQKRGSESLAQFYMKMQNKMLEELNVSHSVGQNYHQAEDVVYRNLSRMSGVQLHSALQGDNVIDMMNIAHALEPNTGLSSKSLDNVAAAVFELDSSDYQDVMNLVGDELKYVKKQNQKPGINIDVDINKRVNDLEQKRQKQGKKKKFGKKQRSMLTFMHDALQEIHSDLGKRHTALFDAFMTGRVALMAVGERLAKKNDANLNIAERQARDLLRMVDEFAGDRNAAERFGGIKYGGFDSDGRHDEEPSPFLQGQDDATLGRAVMVHARTVPLARLQNPIRQLYQRIKPKQLLGERTAVGGVMETTDGQGNTGQALKRARLTGGGTLTMQERRRQRHALLMGQNKYGENPETASGDRFNPVAQGEEDLLETSRSAPMMFAGSGIDTKRQREFHGSAQQELQFGVTSRVAFLPNNHRRIWESQGVSTKARLDALKTMPDVRTQKAAIDLKKLRPDSTKTGQTNFNDPHYDSKNMQDWVQRTAEKIGVGDPKDPSKIRKMDRERELLKEAYYLKTIADDDASGITQRGVDQINAAIELRKRRAAGVGVSDKDLIPLRMQQAEEGQKMYNTGNASALFNPNFRNQTSGGGPIVLEGLNATKHANLLGLDIEVEIDENTDTAALKFHFIEDPTDTIKEMTMGAKVGVFGSDASPVMGMAGETGIMEASFTKKKRRDFANLIQVQIGRLYNSAIEDLQRESNSDGAFSMKRREEIIDDFAKQLAQLSGMDAGEIKRTVLGGNGNTFFADYFEMTYTDEFSRKIERNFTTTKMMAAAKDAGLSMADVFQQGSQMLRRAKGIDASKNTKENRRVQKEVRDKMIEQLDQEIENVQNFNASDNKQGFSRMFGPNGVTGQKRKQALEGLVRKMRRQRELLENLFDGAGGINNSALSDLNEEGSFWDLYVDDQGHLSASFRALAPAKSIQLSKIGGSMFGESFEKRVGRATKRKQSSLLTATLVSHSGSQTIGGATQEEQVFADVMRGWTATKSGMAAFRDKRFRRMVAESIVNTGASSDFFKESNVIEKDGRLFYKRNGREIPLEQHISENFKWKGGELYFTGGAADTKLNVDAFTTLRSVERRKSGVVGMITGTLPDTSVGGTPIGGDGRTLKVVFGKDQSALQEDEITAKEFYELFGKETRAQQHAQFVQGLSQADVQNLPNEQIRSHPEYAVYHNAQYTDDKGARYRQTILNSQYDFLELDLFGGIEGLDEETMGEYVEALRKTGVSEKELARLMFTPETAKEALKQTLPDDEYAARAEVDRAVEHISETQGTSTPKIFVETRTGAARPQQTRMGDDIVKTNVRQWAQLADKLGGEAGGQPIHGIQEAVSRIHDIAQNQDLSTEAGRRTLRRAFDQIFRNPGQDANLTEVRDFYAASLRKAATGLVSQMQEAHARYFGGRYKLSATQMDLQDTFLRLAKAQQSGTDAFDNVLDEVVRDRYLNMADSDVSKFNAIRDQAKQELRSYIETQQNRFGDATSVDDIAKWQGFGVGEGFIGRDAAERALEEMKKDLLSNQHSYFDDASDPANRAKQRLESLIQDGDVNADSLQDMTEREIAILQQEIKNPGSTSGMIAMTVRQPDFTAAGEYEMARLSVFSDSTLRALGKNPSQMHLTSNPLIAWSRKGDFDYDLDFMTVMDSSLVAGMARETRAQTMPIHMVNLFRAMEGAEVAGAGRNARGRQALGAGAENGVGNIDIRQEEFTLEVPQYNPDGTIVTDSNGNPITRKTQKVSQTRVTTPMAQTAESTFGDSLTGFFADAGMALDAVMQGGEARAAYALQQSIVGTFGAYAKQGAIKTRQRNSAFNSLMTRLVEMTGDGEGQFNERQMNELFDAIPGANVGSGSKGGFTQMLGTYNRFNQARSQTNKLYGKASVGDILHMAALTEMEITQAVAIEKYKKGDAQRVSRRVNDVMQSLHGNYSGGISSFDEAWDAFMNDDMIRDNLPFDPDQFFRGFGGDLSSEELAREAFKLQHDMNQTVRMAAKAGVGNNYMAQHANVAIGEIPPGQQVAAATDATYSGTMTTEGLTQTANAVSQALRGAIDGTDEINQFFALQRSRNHRLESIANMADNTLIERMKNTLRELPIGAKGMGLAAVAATGISMLGGGGPDSRASSEQYDLPSSEPRSYAMGNRNTARNQMQMYERRMQRARYAGTSPVQTGGVYQAGRPPTVRATY